MTWRFGTFGVALAALSATTSAQDPISTRHDKLTFHQDAARSGWNADERVLTPAAVRSGRFGPLWQSEQLDSAGKVAPRLFATPLYLEGVELSPGKRLAVVYAVTTTGFAYAVNASPGRPAPGTILWRSQLTEQPCAEGTSGNLSTPVIDRASNRIYVTSCTEPSGWRLHALDLRSGAELAGWPLLLTAATLDRPGLNRNGSNRYSDDPLNLQRGALTLSADGQRLYLTIGRDSSGWLVVVDTAHAAVASTFSTVSRVEEDQGGLWASAGVAVDPEGRLYVASGSKFIAKARKGIAGIFPDSAHHWSQSVLQFRDDRGQGLTLTGTYTPFNYCTAGSNDIDLGSSGTTIIDLPAGTSESPRLLAVGGKQGNFYLLDRDRLPGSLEKRHPCTTEPDRDQSLLAPTPQPHLGLRGPINLFGPYSDYVSMLDQAKSRSTPAYWRDASGTTHVFATGSTKTGRDFSTSVPPGLARIRLVTEAGRPAWPELAQQDETQIFHNPGSPVVSSNGGRDGIVWVLDTGGPRTAPLYGPDAPKAVLFAFDAGSLKLLWKSAPGQLATTGKYNEATVVDGLVLVGTDRVQAFGLGANKRATAVRQTQPAQAIPKRSTASAAAKPAQATKLNVANAASGARVFEARCASCHGVRQPGVPGRAQLASRSQSEIVAALTSGIMRPQGAGLSAADKDAVARYLTTSR